MSEKILSIIVPSYNMEKYLPKCLGSLIVAPELMDRLEVLVVNDGSKDRTSEIAHEFAAKWPETFKVIDKTNGNYGSCINAALPVATGCYVKVLDADDWFETEGFGKYLDYLNQEFEKGEGSADLVLSDFDFVYEDGTVFRTWRFDKPVDVLEVLNRLNTEGYPRLWMHAVAHKTDNLRKIGYRQTEGVSYTDQEWIFYPFSIVRKVSYFPGVLYKYLNGRTGQTCDPILYVKNTPQQLGIVKRMVDCYSEKADGLDLENRNYLRNNISFRLKIVYSAFLVKGRGMLSCEELMRFDKNLKDKNAELWTVMNAATTFGRFHYPYIAKWRKCGYRMPLSYTVYRGLYWLRLHLAPKGISFAKFVN